MAMGSEEMKCKNTETSQNAWPCGNVLCERSATHWAIVRLGALCNNARWNTWLFHRVFRSSI